MKPVYATLLAALAAVSLSAQVTFKKAIGTSGDDEALWVETLPDSSFIVAGSSTGGGFGGQDALLVKFDKAGNILWSKVFGGAGNDVFKFVHRTGDGNLIALGETDSYGAGGGDIYIARLDQAGNTLWERTTGGSGIESARGVCEVSGGFIVTGGTQSYTGWWDIYVQKLDASGKGLWTRTWGAGGGDIAGEPLPALNGEVWVSGFCYNAPEHDAVLMRLSANGDLLGFTKAGSWGDDNADHLRPGGAGLVASGGAWSFSGGGRLEPWIVSYDLQGKVAWAKRYAIPDGNYLSSLEVCSDGGFIFAPQCYSAPPSNALLYKTDADGNVQWAKSFPFGGAGVMRHVKPTVDGGFVAVGYVTASGSTTGRDMFILKTDLSGNSIDCCPETFSLTGDVISPNSPVQVLDMSVVSGPVSKSVKKKNIALGAVTDLCNGPSCCLMQAGSVSQGPAVLCVPAPAPVAYNNDAILGSGDLLQYILFSNPDDPTGSILVRSDTPSIAFDPALMQPGITYYLAAVAGTGLNGNVNLAAACLDVSNAAQVTWLPPPAVTILGNQYLCSGDTLALFATPGLNGYNWSNGQTDASILISAAGIYTVTVTQGNGCSNTATALVTPLFPDTVSIQQVTCIPGQEGVSIQVFNGSNGCDSVVVTQTSYVPSLSGSVVSNNYNGYGVACPGDSNGEATALPAIGVPPFSFLWNTGATAATLQNLAAGTYTVTFTDANACTGVATTTLLAPAPLQAVPEATDPTCQHPGEIRVAQISGGAAPYAVRLEQTIQHSDGATPLVFLMPDAGTFALVLTDANGCELADTVVLEPPLPVEEWVSDTFEIFKGETLTLDAVAAGVSIYPVSVQWTPAAGLSCTTCLDPSLGPVVSTLIGLEVQGFGGCRAAGQFWIVVYRQAEIYFPNVIMPGSADNYAFTLYGDARLRRIRKLQVFDRWGELLAELRDFAPNDPAQGWDGRFRGQLVPPGVYAYLVEVEYPDASTEVFSGDVTVLR